MKILVIDDMHEQREHAKKALIEHEVTVVDSYKRGKKMIQDYQWDIVLTDLSMPGEGEGQGSKEHVGKPTPYGFILALLAVKSGVKKVAIVSLGNGDDGNHHAHPIFWAADDIDGVIIPDKLWAFTGYNCPHIPFEPIKDWAKVLAHITTTSTEGE